VEIQELIFFDSEKFRTKIRVVEEWLEGNQTIVGKVTAYQVDNF